MPTTERRPFNESWLTEDERKRLLNADAVRKLQEGTHVIVVGVNRKGERAEVETTVLRDGHKKILRTFGIDYTDIIEIKDRTTSRYILPKGKQ